MAKNYSDPLVRGPQMLKKGDIAKLQFDIEAFFGNEFVEVLSITVEGQYKVESLITGTIGIVPRQALSN
jgi:hypothetical protein